MTKYNPVVGLHTNRAIALAKQKRSTVSQKALKAMEAGDVQQVIDTLTGKQRAFCEEYMKDMNATQAILRAGYQTANPKQMGFQLMENPAIRLVIDSIKLERQGSFDVTKDFVLRKIVNTIEKAEEDRKHGDVLRGTELLAKHLGMFIDKTEISGPDGEAIKYEKTQQDAADFTRTIAGLVKRTGS